MIKRLLSRLLSQNYDENRETVYKTNDLYICDVRTLLKRINRMSLSTTKPVFAVCTTEDGFNYLDVLTKAEYPCAEIAQMVGDPGDKYIQSARKFPKQTIKAMPVITLDEIRAELFIENDLHNAENPVEFED